ncbi:MAG: hypothetical protein DCE90_07635 [Pseudanabaena sp.]|nr:MAG: hypothetical protein DCE90_07635 [Pseudanabaena sp.]
MQSNVFKFFLLVRLIDDCCSKQQSQKEGTAQSAVPSFWLCMKLCQNVSNSYIGLDLQAD